MRGYETKHTWGSGNHTWRTKSRLVAEWRCCADEKPSARIADCARIKTIRAESAILYKNNPMPLLPLTITVFLVRMLFIRTKNTVGARSAQRLSWHVKLYAR